MSKKILEIIGLTREFGIGNSTMKAVDNVTLSLEKGQILGIVGESGSGKSTLARIVMALDKPTEGNALFEGEDIFALSASKLRRLRSNFQMIFQDPYSSLNPRMKIGEAILEPIISHKLMPKSAAKERVINLLEKIPYLTWPYRRC